MTYVYIECFKGTVKSKHLTAVAVPGRQRGTDTTRTVFTTVFYFFKHLKVVILERKDRAGTVAWCLVCSRS